MSRFRRKESGFTLIELLIVIMVLGLLAAIVMVAVGSSRSDAAQSACVMRVRSIMESAEAVRVKTDAYPAGTIDTVTAPNPLVAPQAGALLRDWPTNSEFVLRYIGAGGRSYIVDVYEPDGTTLVSGCSALQSDAGERTGVSAGGEFHRGSRAVDSASSLFRFNHFRNRPSASGRE